MEVEKRERQRTEKLEREGKKREREKERGGRKRKSERKGAGQVSAWVAKARESCRALSEGKELVYCWYDTATLQRGKCEPSALLLLTRTKRTERERERAHTNMRWTHNVCAHTRTAHPHCRCDKYGFSLVRIIHWGHLQDILSPFEQPPTSQKQGFNERGQTRAVLTGGTRGWGGTQRSCGWLMEGRRGGGMVQVAGH